MDSGGPTPPSRRRHCHQVRRLTNVELVQQKEKQCQYRRQVYAAPTACAGAPGAAAPLLLACRRVTVI
jgi:hypothetical protein